MVLISTEASSVTVETQPWLSPKGPLVSREVTGGEGSGREDTHQACLRPGPGDQSRFA